MTNSFSPSPMKWRLAILDRALALNQRLDDVAEEFACLMHERPPNITKAEAEELARRFPFTSDHIFHAFQTEEE